MKKHIQKSIHHIKQKPLSEQNRYARYAALVVTLGMVGLWIVIKFTLEPQKEYKKLFDTTAFERIFGEAHIEVDELGQTFEQQKDIFLNTRSRLEEQKIAIENNNTLVQESEQQQEEESSSLNQTQ